MAHKRFRNGAWEYVVKRSKILDAPVYFTFEDEAEGDAYAARLEAMLDAGTIPEDLRRRTSVTNIEQLVNVYLVEANPSEKDKLVLRTVVDTKGATPLNNITASWVDAWIKGMKLNDKAAPSTIRSKVGALARCCDWGMRKNLLMMPDHPLRTLPDGYSQYNDAETALTGGRTDEERDRRLEPGEDERIMQVLEAGILPRKQRPLVLAHVPALRCLYRLAPETAMRMREMYTLTPEQVDIRRRTVFLDRTKNGDKRQVPLSSVAVEALEEYGHDQHGARVFPWWNGEQDRKTLHRTTDYLSKLYVNIFEAASCEDLTFHDLRHEATSRLFERTRLSDLEIMKITGHKSQRMLMRYANLRASDLAGKLW